MALTINWNDIYESTPQSSTAVSSLDDSFRTLKRSIRQVMEKEHNWGPFADKDDGSHIPGGTKVFMKGDAATRDGLSNPQEGSLYLLEDSGVLKLSLYLNGSWETISVNDHGELANLLSGDGHVQYLRKDDFTMSGDLDLGGYSLFVEQGGSNGAWNHFTTGAHRGMSHTQIGNVAAISDTIVNRGTLVTATEQLTGSSSSVGHTSNSVFSIKNSHEVRLYIPKWTFCPNINVDSNSDRVILAAPYDTGTKGVGLHSPGSFNYTVQYRYLT